MCVYVCSVVSQSSGSHSAVLPQDMSLPDNHNDYDYNQFSWYWEEP